ncbi:MAG: hypothetical protein ACKOWF_19055, partial [Chloroflexota bacterium]
MATGEQVVVVLNRDLMFGSKIASAARINGLEPRFVRDAAAFAAAVREEGERGALGIVDMNGPLDWAAIADLAGDAAVTTPLIGFGPHVDVEGRRAAKGAGLARILANGEFHRETAEMIARYARR